MGSSFLKWKPRPTDTCTCTCLRINSSTGRRSRSICTVRYCNLSSTSLTGILHAHVMLHYHTQLDRILAGLFLFCLPPKRPSFWPDLVIHHLVSSPPPLRCSMLPPCSMLSAPCTHSRSYRTVACFRCGAARRDVVSFSSSLYMLCLPLSIY